MADASTATSSPVTADDGAGATTMARRTRFPDDFPGLKRCRDVKVLAAAIKGAADSLTSVDLSGGVFGWCGCVVTCGEWVP